MLLRDMPLTVPALEERILITCSCPIVPSTAGGVGGTGISSTANSIVSSSGGTTGVVGRIIDRRAIEEFTARYQVAIPQAFIQTTVGSTEADAKLTLGIKLQHGDSSGGGDLADYSTGSQPNTRTLMTSARTSESQVWSTLLSTAPFRAATLPAYYDLRAAKRYIAAVVYATKNRVTTESSGYEGSRVSASITFAAADEAPQNLDSTSALSTSTSTTT